jgi:hypothetical protein
MWFLPFLRGLTSKMPLSMGNNILKNYDQGWLEWSTLIVLKSSTQNINYKIQDFQSNILKFHLLTFLLVICFFLVIFCFCSLKS